MKPGIFHGFSMTDSNGNITERNEEINKLVIAGWAGSDQEAIEAHIQELALLDVPRPKKTPLFYNVSQQQLTTSNTIDVLGENSSGEAECVLLSLNDGLWLGIGSDHTDRHLETTSVAYSKQVCPKPIGNSLWRFSDVEDHFDQLILKSYLTDESDRKLYQEGSVSQLKKPQELIQQGFTDKLLPIGTALFCGTIATHDTVANGGSMFEVELHDPVLGRSLNLSYTISILPVEE